MKTISDVGEFGIIHEIAKGETHKGKGVVCGIGDDAAVTGLPKGRLLVTTDLLEEGVHFRREWASWEDVGYKALQVNLSDIAAMGGVPLFYLLTLALPSDLPLSAFRELRKGLRCASREAGITCIGGDTDRSLAGVGINITLLGAAPEKIPYRHNARVGDDIYVTGSLGEAALGLAILHSLSSSNSSSTGPLPLAPSLEGRGAGGRVGLRATRSSLSSRGNPFCRRQTRPRARLEAGKLLVKKNLVRAMIDISDGLAADLGHILDASGVGGRVSLENLSPSSRYRAICKKLRLDPYDLILAGGDDYELLFTSPLGNGSKIEALGRRLGIPITRIGEIVKGKGCTFLYNGREVPSPLKTGFRHFE